MFTVDSTDQTFPTTTDLDPFGDLTEGALFVGLGESVHTSGGYLDLKARLIRYLITVRGFRVLAMETPRTDAKKVAAYVASCQGTPEDALKGIFGVFASTATRDLAEWMCQYNQQNPADPVQFVGFDAQQPWDDLTELHDFLTVAAPADAAALEGALTTCDGYGYATAQAYYQAGAFDMPYSQGALDACYAGLDALDQYISDNQAALEAATSSGEVAWATVASLSLRSWQGEKFYYNTDYQQSYEARDVAMAEILKRSRTLSFPTQRAIVWAHNYHLSRAHDEITSFPTVTMGQVLAEQLGESYRPFALVAYEVGINWPGQGNGFIGHAPPSSIEGRLHTFGKAALFADLKSQAIQGFIEPEKKYNMGFPDADLVVPLHQYEGAFFLDSSPPMEALYW